MSLDELNEAQRAAVQSRDGAHLVVAGAGTGKTRTLVHRVAWLIEQGVAPGQIVLLTFTRRAAEEMLDRVAAQVGPEARAVRGGTFHAFALGALRRFADTLGWTPSFTVMDREDAEDMVGLVRSELGYAEGKQKFARKGTVLDVLSRSVNTHKTIQEVLSDQYPQYGAFADAFEAIGRRYAERKQAHGVMDYDDLLVLLGTLLRDHPEARRKLSSEARHVLVDEFQDTNRLQAEIAVLLSSAHGNLMVVGDEAQSIYGFRGASVRNILDFPKLFPDIQITKLEENYRSTQPVLDLANAVLDSAREGFHKRLRAVRGEGPLPRIVDVIDEHDQADAVVKRILALRAAGVPVSKQAVLFRSAYHSFLLETRLVEEEIAFKKFGGMRFGEAAHIKDALALVRLVANPRDAMAWFRVLGWFEGLGEKTAQKIGDAITNADDPVLDAAQFKGRKYHAALLDLANQLDSWAPLVMEPVSCVEAVIAWYRERMPSIYDDAKRRLKDLDALPLVAERHQSIESFLSTVAIDPIEDAKPDRPEGDDDILTLSTIHSSKGLEWEAVHLLQLADGGFPSAWSLDDDSAMEEEIRLLYVAVTRARRELWLTRPHFVRTRGPTGVGPGCSLLEPIEHLDDLVEFLRHDPEAGADSAASEDLFRRLRSFLDL